MAELIVYSDSCLPCTHKNELYELLKLCKESGLTYEVRRANYSKVYQEEAKERSYLKLPFIYNELTGNSAPLLKGTKVQELQYLL